MIVKFVTGLAFALGALFALNLLAGLQRGDRAEINGSLWVLAVCAAWLLARYVL